MFFALSLVFAFFVLYLLIYSKSESNIYSFENSKEETKIKNDILELDLGFDFDTLLMPDELYILPKTKTLE